MAEHQFEYEADGKKLTCSFNVSGGKHIMVHVVTPWGSKSGPKKDSPAAFIASLMAGELYREHKQMN